MVESVIIASVDIFELQVTRHSHDFCENLLTHSPCQVFELAFPDLIYFVNLIRKQSGVFPEETFDCWFGVTKLGSHKLSNEWLELVV